MIEDFLQKLQLSDWVTLAAALLAVISSLVAFAYGHAARLSERRLASLESQISKIDREMVAWGLRCIEAMANVHVLLAGRGSGRSANDVQIQKDNAMALLSALVDAGRLYFINRSPDLVGLDRPYANRGYRPAILDAVMLAHEELRHARFDDDDHMKRAARNVFGSRRVFIAELREEIDRLRDQRALMKMRTNDDNWQPVAALVDEFEARCGAGSFWQERPRSRAEILAAQGGGRRSAA